VARRAFLAFLAYLISAGMIEYTFLQDNLRLRL